MMRTILAAILMAMLYSSAADARSRHRHHHRHHHHSHRHHGHHHHHSGHHRHVSAKPSIVRPDVEIQDGAQTGIASYYHEDQRVACGGGRFDPSAMTAAHPWLPCGTIVLVTNSRNGRQVTVTINDRGPARWTHRIIDLSRAAGEALDMIRAGVVPVTVAPQKTYRDSSGHI